MKSEIGQEALNVGDPAFLDGELIEAFTAYSKGTSMEPLNKPMQARLTAVKRLLGFPLPDEIAASVPITKDGILNSVVFWFELQMEKPEEPTSDNGAAVETDEDDDDDKDNVVAKEVLVPPEAVPEPVVISTGPSGRGEQLGTHWLQACQYFEEIRVKASGCLPIRAEHDGVSRVHFSIDRTEVVEPDFAERRTVVPPIDPLWMRAHQECQEKLKKIQELVISSKEGHRQAAEAAQTIAVDAGQGGVEAIDPQKANMFALGFHG